MYIFKTYEGIYFEKSIQKEVEENEINYQRNQKWTKSKFQEFTN